jgi:hypothetical protein
MVVHRMPADGLIPCCFAQTALLRSYFFSCANISVMQFGRSNEKLWAIPYAFALVVTSGARPGTKIFDHRDLISNASPLAVRG